MPRAAATARARDCRGGLDRLAGRYTHAEHDPVDGLKRRADEIIAEDINVIRLRCN